MEKNKLCNGTERNKMKHNNEKEEKNGLCSKCGVEKARKTCSQYACFKCCVDIKCSGHKMQRIMEGSSSINIQASRKRALAVRKGCFHENSFHYLGETLLLWDFRKYMSVPKWRDDALRRSRKNRELLLLQKKTEIKTIKRNRRKKLKKFCDEWYAKHGKKS